MFAPVVPASTPGVCAKNGAPGIDKKIQAMTDPERFLEPRGSSLQVDGFRAPA